MKAQGWKIKNSERAARSVLECGSPLPLSTRTGRPSVTQSANGLAHAKTWPVIVGALAFVMIACIASAQSYSIDWYKPIFPK